MTEQLPLKPRHIGRPYARGHPTSQSAALGDRSKMRAKVYEVIKHFGPVTDGEIANQLGVDSNSTRPRRLELQRAGMIVAAGRKPLGLVVRQPRGGHWPVMMREASVMWGPR